MAFFDAARYSDGTPILASARAALESAIPGHTTGTSGSSQMDNSLVRSENAQFPQAPPHEPFGMNLDTAFHTLSNTVASGGVTVTPVFGERGMPGGLREGDNSTINPQKAPITIGKYGFLRIESQLPSIVIPRGTPVIVYLKPGTSTPGTNMLARNVLRSNVLNGLNFVCDFYITSMVPNADRDAVYHPCTADYDILKTKIKDPNGNFNALPGVVAEEVVFEKMPPRASYGFPYSESADSSYSAGHLALALHHVTDVEMLPAFYASFAKLLPGDSVYFSMAKANGSNKAHIFAHPGNLDFTTADEKVKAFIDTSDPDNITPLPLAGILINSPEYGNSRISVSLVGRHPT